MGLGFGPPGFGPPGGAAAMGSGDDLDNPDDERGDERDDELAAEKKGGENDAGAKVEPEFEKRGGLAIPAAAAAKGVFTRGGGTSTSKKKAKKAKSG